MTSRNSIWSQEIKNDVSGKFVGFLISPILGFLFALNRLNTKSTYVIFFLFAVFFGLNFTTSIGRDDTHQGDAAAYRQKYEWDKELTEGGLDDVFYKFASFQSESERDIYIPVMSYITARISDNYHIFFALLACVFAYFQLKSLRFFTIELPHKNTFFIFILLFMFAVTNSIFNINGARFNTASWVAVYSMFQIYLNEKKKYIFLAAITPMIHASFWVFLGILLIHYFLGQKIRFWKIAFFLSFLLSSLSMQLVGNVGNHLPDSLQFLVNRYLENERTVQNNLYQVIRRGFAYGSSVLITYMIYLFMKNERIILNNTKTKGLYPLLLVWMTIVNFLMPVPSLGGRYLMLAYPFIAYIWYITFEKVSRYRKVLQWYPLVSLMFVYELAASYLEGSVPVSFYFTSPLYQLYKYAILGVE